jgi:hypothetical protein
MESARQWRRRASTLVNHANVAIGTVTTAVATVAISAQFASLVDECYAGEVTTDVCRNLRSQKYESGRRG